MFKLYPGLDHQLRRESRLLAWYRSLGRVLSMSALKGVTLTELFFVAGDLGMDDSSDKCQKQVAGSIEDSSVVRLLFEVGCL